MSVQEQKVPSSQDKQKTEESKQEKFENELYQTYLLNKCTDWTHGTLTDIRIVPKFSVLGYTASNPSSTRDKIYNLSDLYIRQSSKKLYPTKQEAPFLESDSSQFKLNHNRDWILNNHLDSNLAEKFPKVESIEELYALETAEVEDTNDFHCGKPIFRAELPDLENRGKFERLYTCEYTVIANLECEELVKKQSVVIDTVSSIEELQEESYDSLLNKKEPIFIEFKKSDSGSLKIRKKSERITLLTNSQAQWIEYLSIPIFGLFTGISLLTGNTSIFNTLNPLELLSPVAILCATMLSFFVYEKYSDSQLALERISAEVVNVEFSSEIVEKATGYSYSKAKQVLAEKKQLEKTAKEFKAELKKIPQDVVVTVDIDSGDIQCEDKNHSWNLKENGELTEKAIDFFVEYGFEKFEEDANIKTQIVKDTAKIPDNMNTLQNRNGIHLLPEPLPRFTEGKDT